MASSSSTFTLASMAEFCLFSRPSLFTCPRTPHLSLTVPSRPVKLHLSHSLSFKPITTNLPFSSLVPFASQTSDWAQQDEQNTTATIADSEEEGEVEEEEEEEGSWENESEEEAVTDEVGDFDESPEPREDSKLYVGNLPYDVDSTKIAMLFEQAGTVEIAEVIYNRQTESSRGFGFVTMSTVEEAEKAIEMFHRYDMGGRLLTVNIASPKGGRQEGAPRAFGPEFRVYVGNLSWSIDDARLEQTFSEHGKVRNARVVVDRESGRSRGFGFVTMEDETEMNDAIAALDGQSIDGRAIRVSVAEERPRRSF